MAITASDGATVLTRPPRTALPAVALVGNPNTGKTTLFNALTGLRRHTGNYPGVTVEKVTGRMRLDADGTPAVELLDLPGTYSLAARSPDELVVADVLLGQQAGARLPDAVVVVVDAANLERNLFLLLQVIECGRPVVVALNMMDLARSRGVAIDTGALAATLGCPVVPVVASRGEGLGALRAAVAAAVADAGDDVAPRPAPVLSPLPAAVENAVASLAAFCARHADRLGREVHRVEALRVLVDRGGQAERRLRDGLGEPLAARLAELRGVLAGAGVELVVAEPEARYAWIDGVVQRCVQRRPDPETATLADRVDAVLTHPISGLAVFGALMALVFQAIYTWAAPLMGGIDAGIGRLGDLAGALVPAGPLQSLLVDGIISGVGAVLVFLPQIVILFAFIAILEDCGYMARAAFLMDRLLSRVGLSGRSFVPMLSSFACAVPGIMAARVIENRRDRLTTILVSPLMSCSARLPVYVVLTGAFVPDERFLGLSLRGLTLLGLYLLGVVVAVPVAWLLKKTLLRGPTPPFVMEMPSFKRPGLSVVGLRMFDRGRAFVLRAGTVIFAVTVLVWAVSYYPHSGRIGERYDALRAEARAQLQGDALAARLDVLDRDQDGAWVRDSFLGRAGHLIEPLVRPLGWDWKIGMATLASFPAREVIIATLGTIYNLGDDQDESSVSLRERMRAERHADGTPVYTLPVALGIMVFFALCCQCASTLAVMRRETGGWRWPALTFTYMTGLAYLGALAVYQAGTALAG